MAQNSVWAKIRGTQLGSFLLGFTGVLLKNSSGALDVRNAGDSAHANVGVSKVLLNDASVVTIQASSSQVTPYTLTLPIDDGTPSQALTTNGSGVLSWASAGSTASCWTVDTTSIAFGSASTVAMFTLPANAVIDKTTVIVDTAFDGTASLSVGVNGGSASKYLASGDVNLLALGRYDVYNTEVANGSTEALEIAYSAGSATVGAGRVLVTYAVPA